MVVFVFVVHSIVIVFVIAVFSRKIFVVILCCYWLRLRLRLSMLCGRCGVGEEFILILALRVHNWWYSGRRRFHLDKVYSCDITTIMIIRITGIRIAISIIVSFCLLLFFESVNGIVEALQIAFQSDHAPL